MYSTWASKKKVTKQSTIYFDGCKNKTGVGDIGRGNVS
jgi:hypothetical protein